jgi:hypothetical protein
MDWMQIFLLINVFVLGGAVFVAVEHLWLHFHPREEADPTQPGGVHLPMAVKERLLRVAETDYEKVLEESVGDFHGELEGTTKEINSQIAKLSDDIISEEMERYKKTLDELRGQAEQARSGAQNEIEKHQAELEALIIERQKSIEAKFIERHTALEQQAEAEVLATKKAYVDRIDKKLADAVTSFLSETLQYNADLGAQEAYLLSELEKHKTELIQEVSDER